MFGNKRNYWNMIHEEDWYSTINATLMIHFPPFIHIKGKILLCNYMTILLTLIIRCRLIMWYMLWSAIIFGGTKCFMITPLPLWIIFTRAVWLMLYKIFTQKMTRKQLNAIYIYIYIYLNITDLPEENNASSNWQMIFINIGLLPTIWVSSYSTGDIYQADYSYCKSMIHHYICDLLLSW